MTSIEQPARGHGQVGSRRYQILGRLGVGGMGVVYEASDLHLQRRVAVKVAGREGSANRDAFRQLEREAIAMARVNSPHVCSLYDLVEWRGRPCLIMERLDGCTLQSRLARAPMGIVEALVISEQIADALEAIHRAGLIHQDVKPSNIFVTAGGAIKLFDFGLSEPYGDSSSVRDRRRRTPTSILGSSNYISPERILGRRIDARSDLFSLGAVIYELAAGRQAFAASSLVEVLFDVLHSTPSAIRGEMPGELAMAMDRLVGRLLAKSPDLRFASATDVKKELARIRTRASNPAGVAHLKPRFRTRGSSSWLQQSRPVTVASA